MPARNVEELLAAIEAGDENAGDELFRALYEDLHTRAATMISAKGRTPTLQTTALVHEAYLRLVRKPDRDWNDRATFLSYASMAMRHALLDHARARRRLKREHGTEPLALDAIVAAFEERAGDIEALDAALAKMREFNPEMSRAVELRFFGGASVAETARMLDMSKRTFERRWEAARAWLKAELA
jgi:RNA polymerase sigma factor (TIGR02999 family)